MKCRVVFADDKVKKLYEELKDTNSEEKELFDWLNNAFDRISENAFCGIQISKRLIPNEYIKTYQIDNLWKYNLPRSWRLLYSVARDDVVIISIVLEWMPHKTYERIFKY
jgi:hypothetical protein